MLNRVLDWLNSPPKFVPPRLWVFLDSILLILSMAVWGQIFR